MGYDSGMADNKRSRGRIVAAAVLVLLVGVSLLALLLNRDNDSSGQGTPSVAPTAASPTATSSAPAEPLPPLTAAPAGVIWKLFQGVALPTSRTDGPTRIQGPVHAGFAQTPTGALLADAQISYRTLVDPDVQNLRQVSEAQLAEGPGRTAYLNLLSQLDGRNDPPAGGYAQIVGFRYITYTPNLAVVSLATRDNAGRIQVGTDTLRWVTNDWKLDLPPSGLQQPQVVADLSGYVPWSGIS